MEENDDVTYSKINFSQSGSRKENQGGINEREDVIYSNVNHLREAQSNPNDLLPTPRSEVKTDKRTCCRSTMLLLFLSVLLLVMTICLGVMCVLKADSEAALRENEKNLTNQLKSLLNDKDNLTVHLEKQVAHHSKEKIAQQNQLEEMETLKNNEITGLNRQNENLTSENKDLKTNLSVMETGKNNEIRRLNRENEDLTLKNNDLIKTNLSDLQKKIANLESQLPALQKGCTSGWEYFSGKCYYFSTDKKNWAESRDACVTMGGHLVIIESDAEMNFVKGHVTVSCWIGLTDSVKEGDWRWVDNTAFPSVSDKKFWYGNEPDNWKGENKEHPKGENCARMEHVTGQFFDAFCFESKESICESKAHSSQCSQRE